MPVQHTRQAVLLTLFLPRLQLVPTVVHLGATTVVHLHAARSMVIVVWTLNFAELDVIRLTPEMVYVIHSPALPLVLIALLLRLQLQPLPLMVYLPIAALRATV